MGTVRVTERVSAPFAGSRVNREAGTISGVLLCGFESKNGRTYTPECFRASAAVYEGRPVNCDHGRDTTVDRRLGWFSGVEVGSDGRPRGTLNLLRSHPMTERVLEAAERNPSLFGFSHVADIRTVTRNGREVVESIAAVESVDLVAQGATTNSIFESTGGRTVKLSEWVAGFCRNPKATAEQILAVKRVAEMDGMGELPMPADAPAPDAEEPDADDAVMAAFKAAIGSVVDQAMAGDLDPKAALSKIKELLKSHAGLNSDGTPDTDGDPETGAGEEGGEEGGGNAEESRPTLAGLVAEARAAGLKNPSADDLAALEVIPTAAGRKVVAERFAAAMKVAEGETPKSAGKLPGSGPLPTKKPAAGASRVAEGVPTDADKYAQLVRG